MVFRQLSTAVLAYSALQRGYATSRSEDGEIHADDDAVNSE